MTEEAVLKAAKLLEQIEKLPPDSRKVAEYFMKHISVGDLRAVLDLKKLGVKDPESRIEELISLGILEKGVDCFNLSTPLRNYIFSRRRSASAKLKRRA
ncbi:MAG: hypothetical protein F7C36_00610 [Desulfurococcales archaeon]|nr:hypothetical protein [Desulfurococcales archaeon]